MPDAKSPQNLSMDEILATIRRIIAEDEQSGGTPVADRPAPVPPVSALPVSVSGERAADALHESMPAVSEAVDADDVLDLTDALNEDGSVRRLAPLTTAPGAAEPARASPLVER